MPQEQKQRKSIEWLLRTPAGYDRLLEIVKPTAHPVIGIPSRAKLLGKLKETSEQGVVDFMARREKAISQEKTDPLRYGFKPPMWAKADSYLAKGSEILVTGGNRPGKSEWAAHHVAELIAANPGKKVWCFSTSFETSVRDQQPLIYRYLPAEWRANPKGKTSSGLDYNVEIKSKTGFSEKQFIGPNGSRCRFMNYQQERNVIEGGAVDLVWADEMIPLDWLSTLRSRTVDLHGKIIVTFTPVNGFTPCVGEYFTGAKIEEWTDADDSLKEVECWPRGPRGKVPAVAKCLSVDGFVVWFQPRDNLYVDYTALYDRWKNSSLKNKLIRWHGVTTQTSGSRFPRFGQHNIVEPEQIDEEGTNYHVVDFAWERNWSMLWARVWEHNGKKRVFIYRDWPDFGNFGEWAVPSEKPDGAKGPAQISVGYGLGDYRRTILEMEGWRFSQSGADGSRAETIWERYGDPRSANVVGLQEEGAATIVDMLAEPHGEIPGLDIIAAVSASNVSTITQGVALINDWLEYDDSKPISLSNEPNLYVSKNCENLIQCLKMWTGLGGQKGASKDMIDLLRYLAIMDVQYVDPRIRRSQGGGSY